MNDKQGWTKTTANYLVSTSFELVAFLPWAESAQANQLGHDHVSALSESSFKANYDPLVVKGPVGLSQPRLGRQAEADL